jgi:hypothetical protein
MILVGVDPGKVTGISIWWDPDFFDSTGRGSPLDVAEVDSSTMVPAVIRRMLDGNRPNLLFVERCRQNPRKTNQPEAVEVTGAVRSLAEELHVRCVYQSPGPAKKLASASLLKRIGWWHPSPDGHQNAASAHVLLGMATFMPVRFATLVGI